ncbi:hypothetical protein K439DRAFT_1618613 [Ramaria rubella]|nr:hypothetical protein K439DRAFT_1618613 [Ramaria rubella]
MLLLDPLITCRGYQAPAIECISLLCARLRTPNDQWSLSTKYVHLQSAISEIMNEMALFVDYTWRHLLDWDDKGVVSPECLQTYADSFHAFGAPSHSLFGFIGCTIWQTCRPGMFQELAYTGYKKHHEMKFQGIVTPNGLMVHLAGPFCAPQNDCGVLHESKLVDKLPQHAIQLGSQEGDAPEQLFFQVYGDSAYGISPVILSPYSHVRELTDKEHAWNETMGGVWILVEHGFSLVLQDWPFLQAFWKQKIYGNACGLLYHVAILLTNAHSCFVPNQTAVRYRCDPPMVHEYFQEIEQ